jgi:hypothetical protein
MSARRPIGGSVLKQNEQGDEHDDDLESEVIEGSATETGIERDVFPDPEDVEEPVAPGAPEADRQNDGDEPADSL